MSARVGANKRWIIKLTNLKAKRLIRPIAGCCDVRASGHANLAKRYYESVDGVKHLRDDFAARWGNQRHVENG